MSHTPGPWSVGKGGGVVVANTLPESALPGSEATDYYGGFLIAESITQANARLIAAAPELLEALEVLAVAWRETVDEEDQPRDGWLDKADAAIAKARGEAVQA